MKTLIMYTVYVVALSYTGLTLMESALSSIQ
jgi:hypothetical protein